MKFDDKHSYDKPAATVLKMYSDRAFFERKYKELAVRELEVLEHSKTDTQFRIKCRFLMKNDAPLPDFAKKFLPAENLVTQSDVWDLKAATGRLEIEIKGVPAKISADMALRDEAGRAANHFRWNVSCGIPFVGGKLEQILSQDIQSKSKTDLAASRKILADY